MNDNISDAAPDAGAVSSSEAAEEAEVLGGAIEAQVPVDVSDVPAEEELAALEAELEAAEAAEAEAEALAAGEGALADATEDVPMAVEQVADLNGYQAAGGDYYQEDAANYYQGY